MSAVIYDFIGERVKRQAAETRKRYFAPYTKQNPRARQINDLLQELSRMKQECENFDSYYLKDLDI